MGVRHQLIRGGNEPEQLGQEQLGQGDGHQGGAANEHAGDKQLPAQAGKVALPEEPGHQHGCAHAGSGNDIDEQVHHALGHTKSRKGVAADVVRTMRELMMLYSCWSTLAASRGRHSRMSWLVMGPEVRWICLDTVGPPGAAGAADSFSSYRPERNL